MNMVLTGVLNRRLFAGANAPLLITFIEFNDLVRNFSNRDPAAPNVPIQIHFVVIYFCL